MLVRELEDAGVETAARAAGAAAEESGAGATAEEAAEEAAPAGRTRDQERLLGGLRDIKTLLKQVTDTGQSEDVARMRKFGDLFKKAVKQNDAKVGQKVLDGMRQLAKQVEANAAQAAKMRRQRASTIASLRKQVKNLQRQIS